MTRRLVLALPLALALAVLAGVTGAIGLTALLGALISASVLTPARAHLGVAGHRTLSVIALALGMALGAALAGEGRGALRLPEIWSGIAAAGLALAGARMLVANPPLGYETTVALTVVSLVAAGQTRSGPWFGVAVAAWVASALVALRSDDPARVGVSSLTRRARVATAVLAACAATGVAALLATLPLAHDWVQSRFDRLYTGEARTGFSSNLRLGALRGMLQSDEVVLRVRGPRVDYLRGVVADAYAFGIWGVSSSDEAHVVKTGQGPPGPSAGFTEVSRVSGPTGRLFTPLDAHTATTPHGWARADDHGVLFRAPDDPGEIVWFQAGTRDAVAPVAPPEAVDTHGPPGADGPRVAALAREWTAGAGADPRARLAALQTRLGSDYRYSLSYRRDGGDPVVDFLLRHKEGHCEYFASAMALLARSLGIPARLVGGYRVAERSRVGDYWIVRERHAHAWVEAWLPGEGWTTWDPTPASALADDEPHDAALVASLVDLIRVGWAAALDWTARSPLQLAALAAGMTAVLALLRWLRLRRAGGRSGLAHDAAEPTPECLERLLAALASRGQPRALGETLARFAARLGDARTAELLERYAAHRYGGKGELGALSREMLDVASRLGRAAPLGPP